MKKVSLVIVMLVLAAPAMAVVEIIAVDEGSGVVRIDYNNTDAQRVRAFALDISVDTGTIDAISDYFVGECNSTAQGYGIFPGSIAIDSGGTVTDYNNPVAPAGDANAAGPLGSGAITIEMGSLYESTNFPANQGTLCKITVTCESEVSVVVNARRGGIVMEDPNTGPTSVNLAQATGVPAACGTACYTGPDAVEWAALGSPSSWCLPRQCHGDLDGGQETIGKTLYWVGYADLAIFLANWQDQAGATEALKADMDHASEIIGKTPYRCGYNDLAIFLANWQDQAGTPDPNCAN